VVTFDSILKGMIPLKTVHEGLLEVANSISELILDTPLKGRER